MTERLGADQAGIDRAALLLRAGQLISFPTETVYGLGADAENDRAVAGVFAAKGRPSLNPLIVHVPDIAAARRYVVWSDTADRVASAFWPGPLTLVLPLADGHGISRLVTAGLDTLAIRVPAHPVAQRLLTVFGGPVAAPSANLSGQISPTRAEHVLSCLDGRIAAVLDAGPTAVGVESTILGLVSDPEVLRPGGLPLEALGACLGGEVPRSNVPSTISAPGQLASHYAPKATLRLNAMSKGAGETLLGFGDVAGDETLSTTGDLVEAAAQLFEMLHRLDARGLPMAVAPIPDRGLGIAINDRLRRASAPR
ncbi:MAG: threonylcarbamoyl-AMP synthase [Rhodobacteraceae bacterium]|nr:threonylcarbamoyl-AMP synthase [Paracoccaceae bacterium]